MPNYEITRVYSTQYFSIRRTLLNALLTVRGDSLEMKHSVEECNISAID